MPSIKPLKEEDIQMALVQWINAEPRFKELPFFLFYSVANERKSNAYHMAKLKKMGLLPGVSDLVFDWDDVDGNNWLLYLELKRKGGKLSENQKKFKDRVVNSPSPRRLYRAAWSFIEAKEIIEELIL